MSGTATKTVAQRLRKFGIIDYGKAIHAARLAMRWSQHDLAARCGGRPNQSTISMLESGRHQPNLHTLRALDKAFGRPVESFLQEAS